jgi:SulP family sulfate permease
MASVLFVKRMADVQMQSARIGSAPAHLGNLSKQEAEILEQADGRIVIFHVEGPLSFGSAKDISRMLASSRNLDVLIIDLSDVPFIDSSASITLEEAIQTVQKKRRSGSALRASRSGQGYHQPVWHSQPGR